MSSPFTPVFPNGIDPPVVIDSAYQRQGGIDANDRRRIDAQILALENYVLAPPTTINSSQSQSVYVSNVSVSRKTQWIPVNTVNGSFTVTFPSLVVPSVTYSITDVGLNLSTNPVVLNGNGIKIFNPDGPHQGTLQNTYTMSVSGSTWVFSLVPSDPINGTFWMPVGDGVVSTSLVGVATSTQVLTSISQWVPVNTVGGSFSVYLPLFSVPPIQIAVTDVGFDLSVNPITINGNGYKIYNPTGPNHGTLQNTYLMNQSSSTYVFNLVPNDPVNGTFWMVV